MMRSRSARTLIRSFSILTWALCAHAFAWDRVIDENPQSGPGTFSVLLATAPDASGFWASGNAQGNPLLVRYDADREVAGVHFVARPGITGLHSSARVSGDAEVTDLTALPDGGVLAQFLISGDVGGDYSCFLMRYDAQGARRWSLRTASQDPRAQVTSACSSFAVDASEGLWLGSFAGDRLSHLAADGSTLATIDFGATRSLAAMVADPADGGVYALVDATVRKYGPAGQLVWSRAFDGTPRKLQIGSDGNVTAFGIADSHLSGASYSSTGAPRWSATFPNVAANEIAGIAAAPEGGAYVAVDSGGSAVLLLAVSATGTEPWLAPFSVDRGDQCLPPFTAPVVAAPNGDALLLYAASLSCPATSDLYRLTPDGSVVFDAPLSGRGSRYAWSIPLPQPDGSILLAATGHFLLFSADGAMLAPATNGPIAAAPPAFVQTLAGDSATYFLTGDGIDLTWTLTAFDADGQRRWQQSGAGIWGNARVVANDTRTCIVGPLSTDEAYGWFVDCRDAQTGASLWTTALPGTPAGEFVAARLLADGRVVVIYGNRHALVAADGSVLHDVALGTLDSSTFVDTDIDASGEALIAAGQSSPTFTAVAVDGTTRYSVPFGFSGAQTLAGRLVGDGTAVLVASSVSSGGNNTIAARVDGDGNFLWQQTPGIELYIPFTPAVTLLAHGTDVYLAVRSYVWGFVTDLALDSGALRWNTPIARQLATDAAFDALFFDSTSGRLVFVGDAGNKFRLTMLDASSGAVLRDRLDACLADYCLANAAALDAGGALRVLATVPDPALGLLPRVYVDVAPFALPAATRIDQPGLDGAWYAPYESGQGFTFDWIAGANTLFMPWFTFAQSGINDPAGLAWYSLQGTVAAGATSAELAIAVSDPGVFNAGSVPGRQVGTAHLSFSDCSHGTLVYQFDADTNGGAGGLITLARLTPGTDPCVLADGSSVPAQNANPPAGGFDARQSGSWFDPDTAGQGIELTIVPAGNGSPGLVFSPWFTFDPAVRSDDVLHQHWFTLQGDLSAAAGGRVTLPIYRIIGGAFDAMPTSNFSRVGQATLTMQGCDSALLDYQFDPTEVAHAFSGLSGTSHLIRIGGCVPTQD